MELFLTLLYAFIGSLITNCYRLFGIINNSNPKKRILLADLKKEYWLQFFIEPIIAMVVIFVYYMSKALTTNPVVIMQLGASVPLLFKGGGISINIDKNKVG